jgi:putative Mn2+ efflux pump MntP
LNFGVTTKLIAVTFALCGFAVAVLSGLSAGNSASRVLTTALVSMVVCQLAGLFVGSIGERVVNEHMESYRRAHSIGAEESAGKTSPPDPQNL